MLRSGNEERGTGTSLAKVGGIKVVVAVRLVLGAQQRGGVD